MKLNAQARVGVTDPLLQRVLRENATQVNLLTEGRVSAVYNAATAIPTTDSNALGDFRLNSAPAELGTIGSKYIIHGWRCVLGGAPGTWVECRFLTGN